ncbi:unnamed protein product [Notodromas monacha]|uniref:WD repeat domain-containing protein 83 n=1 Tax=Notodromas monacha TaxID=399045 RepID=A0A7R9BGE8_9CRUS|nr:unnamed protein product [Notodromas monacha]CAG0914139.1 unnamed protein product [Notodromas monacha]
MPTESESEEFKVECKHTLNCKNGAFRSVAWNVDGNYCLTSASDKSVMLWNPHKGKLLQSYVGHGSEALVARSSGDNGSIASGGADRTVILWDVATAAPLKRWREHAGKINGVCFNELSSVVISASADATGAAWDTRSKSKSAIITFGKFGDSATSAVVDEAEVLFGCLDGKVWRFDLRNGKQITDTIGAPVVDAEFSSDSQCVLVSTMDNCIRLFDKVDGKLLAEYVGHVAKDFHVRAMTNFDDSLIVGGSENGKLLFWRTVSSNVVLTLDHPEVSLVNGCAHPKENKFLSIARNVLRLWGSPEDDPDSEENIE